MKSIAERTLLPIGEGYARTELDMAPCLRKDFVDQVAVRIEGLYFWGSGYGSKDLYVSFLLMVFAFCEGHELQYTPEDMSSGQLSDNKDSYFYFMGMDCTFRTTKESEHNAMWWATRFADCIKDLQCKDGKPVKIKVLELGK